MEGNVSEAQSTLSEIIHHSKQDHDYSTVAISLLTKAQLDLVNNLKNFQKSVIEFRQLNLDNVKDPRFYLRTHCIFLETMYHLKLGDISQANELLQRLEKEEAFQQLTVTPSPETTENDDFLLPTNPLLIQSIYHLLAVSCRQTLSPSISLTHISNGLDILRRYQSQLRDDPDSSRVILPTIHIREYLRTVWIQYMFLEFKVHILLSQRNFHEAVDALKEAISLFLSHELKSAHPPTFLSSLYVLLASFGGSLRKAEDAILYLDEALNSVRKGSSSSQAISLLLSASLIQAGRLDDAEKVMQMYGMKDEDEDINLVFGTAFYFLTGLISFHRRNFSSSRNLLTKALNMSSQTLNLDLKARILLSLVALDMEEGFHSAASSKIHTVEESLSSSGNLELLASLSLSKSYLSSLSENYEQMDSSAATADVHLQKLVSLLDVTSQDELIPKLFPPQKDPSQELSSLQTNSSSSSSSSSSSHHTQHPFDIIHSHLSTSSASNSLNWEQTDGKSEVNSTDYFSTFLSTFRESYEKHSSTKQT